MIEQAFEFIAEADKYAALARLLEREMDGRRLLIFCETKRGCDAVTRQLRTEGWPALSIHGDKSQQERDWVLAVRGPSCLGSVPASCSPAQSRTLPSPTALAASSKRTALHEAWPSRTSTCTWPPAHHKGLLCGAQRMKHGMPHPLRQPCAHAAMWCQCLGHHALQCPVM